MKKIIILFFAILVFISCKNEPQQLVRIEGKQLPVTDSIAPKNSIESLIKPYREKVSKEMNAVLSYTPIELNRLDGEFESSLGNLLADMCYNRANPVFNSRTGNNIDFALFNFGGIRAGIPKGEITNKHAFQLMPFENSLVVVELTADKINELVEYLIRNKKAHPLSKHVKLQVFKDGYDLKINNSQIDKTKTYFVLTSDYLQNGGDNMTFFSKPVNLYKTDYKMRSAIIDYFTEKDTVITKKDGRFTWKQE